jgi:hypothetical protein
MRNLVPEDISNHSHRRALVRAITAQALSTLRRSTPISVLSRAWPGDDAAERALGMITRAATSPLKTGDAPALVTQGVRALARLAPRSAALQLFDLAMSVDMSGGLAVVKIPNISTVPAAAFVAEGAPAPLVEFDLGGATLGPVRKIVILSAVTRELETASPEAASQIIGRLLAASAEKGIDSVAFGTAAENAAQPAGLLHNVTPLAATAGGGTAAMIADIANLVDAVAVAELDASTLVIVASPAQAVTLALLAGPRFNFPILSTNALPAGTVAAFVPDAIAAAFEGAPEIATSQQVALHFEDVAPLPIGSPGSPSTVASPVRSAFQQDIIAIKCSARLAFVLAAPGGAQVINSVTW